MTLSKLGSQWKVWVDEWHDLTRFKRLTLGYVENIPQEDKLESNCNHPEQDGAPWASHGRNKGTGNLSNSGYILRVETTGLVMN